MGSKPGLRTHYMYNLIGHQICVLKALNCFIINGRTFEFLVDLKEVVLTYSASISIIPLC